VTERRCPCSRVQIDAFERILRHGGAITSKVRVKAAFTADRLATLGTRPNWVISTHEGGSSCPSEATEGHYGGGPKRHRKGPRESGIGMTVKRGIPVDDPVDSYGGLRGPEGTGLSLESVTC
jgi:hypothetical protein